MCEKLSVVSSYKAQGIIIRKGEWVPQGKCGIGVPSPTPFSWSPEQALPLFSLSFFFEKWALMTSIWEADPVQEFPNNSPRQTWLAPDAPRSPKHPPPAAHDWQSPG